jgi:hypothetical protein
MADNVTLDPGTGGAVIATDDDGTAQHQYVKLEFGPDNTFTKVSTSNPLPVDLRADNLAGNIDVNIAASGATVTVDSELTLADLDTGAGTDNRAVVGLVLAASGGGLLVGAANPMPISDNGGAITVDGSVSITGAVDTELPAAAALADNAANPTVPGVGAFGMVFDGSTWDRMLGDATNGLLVNLGANNDVTISGTPTVDTELPAAAALSDAFANPTAPAVGAFLMGYDGTDWERIRVTNTGQAHVAVQNTVTVTGTITAAQATASSLNAQVVGATAHGAADAGNPIKVGGVGRVAHPTAVDGGDRADLYLDDLGRIVTYPMVPRDLSVHNRIVLSDTTETTLIAAGGAGVIHDLVWVFLSNGSGTAVRVDIRDDTAGTVRFSAHLAATGGGANVIVPIPLKASADNDNWTAQLSASVSSVYITAIAIKQN